MRFLFINLLLLTVITSFAGEIKYPVSSISEKLLKNADAVKRTETIEFEIVNLKETILHYKYAITILNENADDYSVFSEWYDQFRNVSSVEGYLYDKDGNLLKKMKYKDLQDVSATDDNNLVDDYRSKRFAFYYKTYPYTIEFEATIKSAQTFWLSYWIAQEHENLSVEQSSFKVLTPENYLLRHRSFNYNGEPTITSANGKKTYYWQASQLAAFKKQFAAPRWHELTTMVSLAPSDFAVDDFRGSMNDWNEFGKFMSYLKKDRDKLPEDVLGKVLQLTANASTDLEKIKLLYKFLQQNTRYISIQLGIGGWQPFEAAVVSKKGYGDCKALTNYMYSLLKAVGIKSYYALIKAGKQDYFLMEDFPSNQFNHAILCVPLQKDTIWLECTSQLQAFGYMGDFTGNRKALIVTEDGGKIVSTPRYGLKENIQLRTIKATLNEEGTLLMNVATKYGGTQQDRLSMVVKVLSKDKVDKYLQEEFQLATYHVNSFNYQETKTSLPELDEKLNIEASNYATIAGKRLFIIPNILNRGGMNVTTDEERTVDFIFDDEWKDEDDYEIELPDGYKIEAAPQDVVIRAKYGSYFSSTKLEGNKLIYHRIREQYKGRFPAKEQAEIAKFYSDIFKADRARVVLVKKES